MENQEPYILQMKGISKFFPGVKALDKVSLNIRPQSVHALVGENGAGKSTLMKCLFGIYHPDEGEIVFQGRPLHVENTREALNAGIAMIHQEAHPIRFRPVMENVWLGRFPKNALAVSPKKMYQMTKELFREVDLDVNPYTLAGDLSPSTMQLVEIAKAISYDAKIIIMDEPTSSLTDNEVEHLFEIIRKLKAKGCAIIYISHKMEEIKQITDEITIMRDGEFEGTYRSQDISIDEVIAKMVGRDMSARFPEGQYQPTHEVALRVEGLTAADPHSFRDISFQLYKGEILGIGGLVGAQRTEMVEAIFGLRGIVSGTIYKDGKIYKPTTPRNAIRHRLALLTEERRSSGIFSILSVLDNTVVVQEARKPITALIHPLDRHRLAVEQNANLRTKTPSMDTLIQNLSGGNQQKVLLARWLLSAPDILILDEPTRGIDVGAKYEIYTIMQDLAKAGKAVIMISSEMPELIGMSDRILVMCEGRVSGIINGSETNQVEIMRLATKFMK